VEEKHEKRDVEARLREEVHDKATEAINRQIGQMAGDIFLLMS